MDIKDGDVLDLGNAKLDVYTILGHTPGGIVLLDEYTGDLFSSDEFGSNRRYVPDSAWLQISDYSIESCLRRAFENGVKNGEDALVPSLRSAAESFGSGCIIVDGDWRHGPMWNAANVKFLYEKDRLSDPLRYTKGDQKP